jgi:hypothetical protein
MRLQTPGHLDRLGADPEAPPYTLFSRKFQRPDYTESLSMFYTLLTI